MSPANPAKARLAAVFVIVLLTASVFALGFSALGSAQDGTAASGVVGGGQSQANGDNAAVSAFKFVCPFH